MKIELVAVGTRMPAWVSTGFAEYARRMPPECALRLVEVPAAKRGKSPDHERILGQESRSLLARVPDNRPAVALDVAGRPWDTPALARQLERWLQSGTDMTLLVGGPDGLGAECKARAGQSWSLSPLTLPHPLVRIVAAEALYRAWSVLANHPYHRAG